MGLAPTAYWLWVILVLLVILGNYVVSEGFTRHRREALSTSILYIATALLSITLAFNKPYLIHAQEVPNSQNSSYTCIYGSSESEVQISLSKSDTKLLKKKSLDEVQLTKIVKRLSAVEYRNTIFELLKPLASLGGEYTAIWDAVNQQ